MTLSPLINTCFTVPHQTDNVDLNLIFREKLGEGSFGQAYRVEREDAESNAESLVCKIVNLQGRNDYIHFSSHTLLRMSYREIAFLKKRQLLVGYTHDPHQHEMRIIMKLLPGRPEQDVENRSRAQAEYASFVALRALHRDGIAHMDPHDHNFLFQASTGTAEVIDFGLANDYHFFRGLYDYYVFLYIRKSNPSFLAPEGIDALYYLTQFYCRELKEYIFAHQWVCAKNLFFYGALVIALLGGVSIFSAATLIAQELVKVTFTQAVSELLEALQDHAELHAWNLHNPYYVRGYYFAVCGALMAIQILLLAEQITHLSQATGNLHQGLAHWRADFATLTTFPAASLGITALNVKPLVHTAEYIQDNLEKYLYTQTMLSTHYQSKITASRFLPGFSQGSNVNPPEPPPLNLSRHLVENKAKPEAKP